MRAAPLTTADDGDDPEVPLDARLSDRQRHALPVVLAAPTLKGGLEAAGVHRTTWARWLTDSHVRGVVEALRRESVTDAMADLKGGTRFAVTSVLGLLASKNEHVRLAAARTVLESAQQAIETEELQERLARIEHALASLGARVPE